MKLSLGQIPQDLQTAIERWIAEAKISDPNKLYENKSLTIAVGPAWYHSIVPDGRIWIHTYSDDEPILMSDGIEKIIVVVIAGKRRPVFLSWLPDRPALASDCPVCESSGWMKLMSSECVCNECAGLGWLPDSEDGPCLGQVDSNRSS